MSTPNPLAPKGSLLEEQARSKSSLQIAALIVALHVFVCGGLLILGCDKEKKNATDSSNSNIGVATNDIAPPPITADVGAVSNLASNVVPGTVGSYVSNPPPAVNPGFAPVPAVTNAPIITEAAPPTQPAAGSASDYKVKKGDYPAKIASANGITTKALLEANPGLDPKKLKENQIIHLPASAKAPAAESAPRSAAPEAAAATTEVTYTVKGGDTLTRIAKKYGTTTAAIRTANQLKSSEIKAGQKLKVPSKAAAAEAPASTGGASPVPTVLPLAPDRTGRP
jgi:LysM repeat protein